MTDLEVKKCGAWLKRLDQEVQIKIKPLVDRLNDLPIALSPETNCYSELFVTHHTFVYSDKSPEDWVFIVQLKRRGTDGVQRIGRIKPDTEAGEGYRLITLADGLVSFMANAKSSDSNTKIIDGGSWKPGRVVVDTDGFAAWLMAHFRRRGVQEDIADVHTATTEEKQYAEKLWAMWRQDLKTYVGRDVEDAEGWNGATMIGSVQDDWGSRGALLE